jgi:multicomponent K+:H+ antiporter subunit A
MIQGNALLVLLLLPFAGSVAAALLPTGRNAEAWLAGGVAVAGLIATLLL